MAKQGPSKAELDAIKQSLKEIEQLYIKLGGINPFKGVQAKNIASSVDEVNRLKNELQDARDAVSDMEGEAGDLFKSWRAITDEIKGYRRTINDSKSTVSKINELSQKLKDHQTKVNSLSAKDLNNIKSKLEQQKSILKTNQDSLQNAIDELKTKQKRAPLTAAELAQLREAEIIQKNITGGLEKDKGILDSTIAKAQKEAKARKDIENSLGTTGGLLKGLSKIPLIGNIVDTEKILKASNDEIELSKSGIKGLGAGFKEMGSQIKSGLLNPANLASLAITELIVALKKTDEEAGNLAKTMNMTYSEALNTRRELGNIAAVSGDVALTTKGLQESYVAIGKSLGSNAMASEETLITMTKLREQAGYTNEQLTELNKLSLVNGKSLEDNTKEILGGAEAYASQIGLVLNEKDILNDVVNASASLKLSLGGSTDALAKAAVQARSVGINLETAAAMADQLLQFESSIENELSAELLLGKDLNFERARQLALNNDIAGAAEEIANQVGSSADFAEMNAIQQEAIAKAAGMTKDQLAQSLMDREALANISAKEGESAQEAFNRLVKEVGMEEAKKQLGEEQLANQYAQQNIQERFNQAVEKLREIFVQIAEPILAIVSPLMDLVSTVLPAINLLLQPLIQGFQLIGSVVGFISNGISSFTGWLAKGSAAATALKVVLAPIAALVGVIAAGMIYASLAAIPVIGPALGAIAVVGMIAMLGKAAYGALSGAQKGEDVFSPGTGGAGSYGQRMLFDRGEIIALNDSDNVIATTNPIKPVTKANDMYSKGAITVSNSTSPKKEPMMDPNASTNARLDALIAITGKVNTIPTLRIQ